MTIFTPSEVLFFMTGALAVLAIWLSIYFNNRSSFSWYTWGTAFIGGLLLLTAIGWAGSSIIEGEHQAANMGLLIFGVPALVFLGLTGRSISRREN
jgi:CDP-diglyceride synthetase